MLMIDASLSDRNLGDLAKTIEHLDAQADTLEERSLDIEEQIWALREQQRQLEAEASRARDLADRLSSQATI